MKQRFKHTNQQQSLNSILCNKDYNKFNYKNKQKIQKQTKHSHPPFFYNNTTTRQHDNTQHNNTKIEKILVPNENSQQTYLTNKQSNQQNSKTTKPMSALSLAQTQPTAQTQQAPIIKRAYKCGHCKQAGHNRKTCPLIDVASQRKAKTALDNVKLSNQCQHDDKKHDNDEAQEPEQCSICFEICDDSEAPCCQLECKHKYHTSCIFKWMSKNNNCPLCRKEVKELKPKPAASRGSSRQTIILPSTHIMWEAAVVNPYMTGIMSNTNINLQDWCLFYSGLKQVLERLTPAQLQTLQNRAESRVRR